MKLREIAELISGEVIGNPETEITGVSGISDAKDGDITYLIGIKWLRDLRKSQASAVIVREPLGETGKAQVVVKNPHLSFARLLAHFYVRPEPSRGISDRASVSEKAKIGEDVTVCPFACVSDGAVIGSRTVIYPGVFVGEGCVVGEGCLIYPNVTIREGVTVGNRVIIHAGTVLGADGFGYVYEDGVHHKIPQVGTVIIEDDVEIGANTTIDRATTGATVIGKGTKIDNLVQIGHNVRVGKNAIIVAQVGIAGSSHIGDGVILGGQVGVADHTTIEAGTMIGAKSGALGEMKRGVYSGTLPMPHRDWLKAQAVFARLPELKKKVEALEQMMLSLRTSSGHSEE